MSYRLLIIALYALRLYLGVRWVLFRHRIPYKYVKNEVMEYIENINTVYFRSQSERLSYVIMMVDVEFSETVKENKIIENKKFKEKLTKIFD